MANFGDNLRGWIDTEWKTDDEKAMKTFQKEWEKATRKLVASTPKGQIRFALISRWQIIRKLTLNPFFRKTKHFMRLTITKVSHSKPFFSASPSDLYFPNLTFPNDQYTDPYLLIFYANNIEEYSNAGRDFIEFWFETQILPDFERETKKRKSDYRATSNNHELYFYSEIKNCLEHFDIKFTEDEYKEIFTHLCDKNGVKLLEFSSAPEVNSFKISL